MQGLQNGMSLGRGIAPRPVTGGAATTFPIVAWGDSLTFGTGASPGHDYLSQAATLLADRTIANRGVGGQAPASIAARQGGVPILVTLVGDQIPARQSLEWDWSFVTNPPDMLTIGGDRGATVSLADGAAVIHAPSWLQGISLPLGRTIPKDTILDLSVQMTVPPGMIVRVSGFLDSLISWAAHDGHGNEGKNITSSGTHRFSLHVGGLNPGRPETMNQLVFLTEDTPAGTTTFSIDHVSMTAVLGDASTAASVAPIPINAGARLSGTMANVSGTLTADDADTFTFRRSAFGPSSPCPPSSTFTPDDATRLRRHTQWIWLGNNGVYSPEDAGNTTDIVDVMIENVGHSRYLVLAALPRPDRVEAITAFNALLATRHEDRLVDVLSALRTAGNGSPGDTADIAAGLVPRSLRSDNVHLNDAGYAIVAHSVVQAMHTRRW